MWCAQCDDTGWVTLTRVSAVTGQPSTAVQRCWCRASNPVYQRKREAQTRYATRKTRKNGKERTA